MSAALAGISSMATRQLLAELLLDYERRSGRRVAMESVGGVDAARRVLAGESFDVAILASEAIDKLIAAGRVALGSKVDLVHSGVAVCVRAGVPRPDISSEEALRRAVQAAATVGYSTGPSGVALARLFLQWGMAGDAGPRMVQAPAGVPVGSLVARGEVALGFQQLGELLHLDGVDVIGPLPAAIQITTTFSGGLCAASTRGEEVKLLLEFLAAPEAAPAKHRHGMAPA